MPKGGGITQLGANQAALPAGDPFANAPGFKYGSDTNEGGATGGTTGGTTGGEGNSENNDIVNGGDFDSEDTGSTDFEPETDGDNAGPDDASEGSSDIVQDYLDNESIYIGTNSGSNAADPSPILSPEEEEGMPARWETRQPREFGSSDFYAQYPTSSPTFGDLLTRHEETPESDSFNYGGVVYNYDAARNVFTDRYSGREISATNGATGSLGIDGLYG